MHLALAEEKKGKAGSPFLATIRAEWALGRQHHSTKHLEKVKSPSYNLFAWFCVLDDPDVLLSTSLELFNLFFTVMNVYINYVWYKYFLNYEFTFLTSWKIAFYWRCSNSVYLKRKKLEPPWNIPAVLGTALLTIITPEDISILFLISFYYKSNKFS